MEPHSEVQTIFGTSGLKRKSIEFVPAGTEEVDSFPDPSSRSLESEYLAIVLKNRSTSTVPSAVATGSQTSGSTHHTSAPFGPTTGALCALCDSPIAKESQTTAAKLPHALSLAHQFCMRHSYPPSHLDRNGLGLKYLSAYGWDPDDRLGLGVQGEGRRAPIKAKMKIDTVGLGARVPKGMAKPQKMESMDAGKVRKKHKEDRKKAQRLQDVFYQNEDVEKFLATG